MELLNHIGLVRESYHCTNSFFSRVNGFLILLVLLTAAILYKLLSIACIGLYYLFPESVNSLKRISVSMFWELCLYFLQLNNVRFVITGDEINTDSAVIISNHKSLADFIAMAYLARYSNNEKPNEKGRLQTFKHLTLPQINFFSWFRLWRVPSLRVLINLAKCDENWELEQSLNRVVFGSVMKTKVPEWIILFPEVNIWTEEDSSLQKVQSEKFYLPKLQNVLYPRFSAFYNVVSTLNKKKHSKFNKLYDVSILYEFGLEDNENLPNIEPANAEKIDQSTKIATPNLVEIFSSATPVTIHLNVKSKTLQRIPTKRNKLEKWLEHTWVEKDKFLEQWELDLSNTSSTVPDLVENTSRTKIKSRSIIGLSKIKL